MAKPIEVTSSGDGARSDTTRHRLLEAGLALFSSRGFDGVSTRALATTAGVNQAAIPYHFQSKQGLYLAVAERIVERVEPGIGPVLAAVRRRHQNGVCDLRLAREDVARLIIALLRQIVSQPDKAEIGYFILREQMQPTAAMDIIYDGMIAPMHEMLARLVAPLLGKAAGDPGVIIEVQALYGQAIVFGVHRTTLLRRLGVNSLDDARIEQITSVVRNLILRQFPV